MKLIYSNVNHKKNCVYVVCIKINYFNSSFALKNIINYINT